MVQILAWVPACIWMGVIFYLSSQTQEDLHGLFPFLPDLNWGHVAAYFVLALLFRYALTRSNTSRAGVWSVTLSLLYGISDEYHQSFVPTRQPDVMDLMADLAGALAAVILWRWLWSARNRRGRESSEVAP